MVNKIISITGPAGTGKSTIIQNQLPLLTPDGDGVLFCSFNRSIRDETYESLNPIYPKMRINTVHELCFHVLKSNEKLPKRFKNLPDDFESTSTRKNDKLNGSDFEKLISEFLRLNTEEISRFLPAIKIVILDEYQDFRISYKKVIKKLSFIYSFDQYVMGDRHQKIYGYLNKGKTVIEENFNTLEEYDCENIIHISLTKNHRSTPPIQELVNGFLTKSSIDVSEQDLYSVDTNESKYKHSKPKLRFVRNMKEEVEFVRKQIDMMNTPKKILIISAYNRDLKRFNGLDKDFPEHKINITTVHKAKGLQADVVFYVGFQKEGISENVIYVGLTRPHTNLFITTSFPKREIIECFDPDSVEVIGAQAPCFKPFRQLKKIINNKKNMSFNKFSSGMIDSVVFRVGREAAPYLRNIEPNLVKTDKSFNGMVVRKEECKGVEICIKYLRSHQQYRFEILDLNPLKKNGYTDEDILKFGMNFVGKFFDYRVEMKNVEIARLDLYKCIRTENKEERNKLYTDYGKLSYESTAVSRYSRKKGKSKLLDGEDRDYAGIMRRNTLYNNFHRNEYNSVTVVAYDPSKKENKNTVSMRGLMKVEIRILGSKLKRAYALGERCNAADLLASLQGNGEYLKELYHRVYNKFMYTGEESKRLYGYIEDSLKMSKLGGSEEFQNTQDLANLPV